MGLGVAVTSLQENPGYGPMFNSMDIYTILRVIKAVIALHLAYSESP
jgi:hypothetical protein